MHVTVLESSKVCELMGGRMGRRDGEVGRGGVEGGGGTDIHCIHEDKRSQSFLSNCSSLKLDVQTI